MEEETKMVEDVQPESAEEQVSPATPPEKQPDKKKLGIIIGIAAAVVVVIAVALILILGGNNNTPPTGDGGVEGEIFTGSDSYVEEPDGERSDFITALGGVSETFTGVISEKSFDNSDDAAKAFIDEEISGESNATVQSLNHRGSLSESQIQSLKIPADILEGSESVDVIDVAYTLQDAPAEGAKSGTVSNTNKTVTVIVVKYENYWKYFTPMPVNGNTISKSYYDSVFNYEKYKNCTVEFSQDVIIKAEAGLETMTMTMSTTQKAKYADGKIYIETTVTSENFPDMPDSHICLYLEDKGEETICYVKRNESEGWIKGSLSAAGYSSAEELTPFYNQYLDYTYFTKTSFGFALEDESARKYFNDAIAVLLGEMLEMIDQNSMNLDMYAEYYVCDGVLSGIRLDAGVDLKVDMGEGASGSIKESVISVNKCYDYGTTVVENPVGE